MEKYFGNSTGYTESRKETTGYINMFDKLKNQKYGIQSHTVRTIC